LKLVVDLERIGDLGVSIATRVVELDSTPSPLPYDEILPMLTMARQMVSESVAALVTGDAPRARAVIDKDEILDSTYAHMFHQILSRLRDDSIDVANATRVQAITKYIERIGDHAVNIAERVIFVLTGEDVRHQPRLRRSELS
jgi:phosphate transport system protein